MQKGFKLANGGKLVVEKDCGYVAVYSKSPTAKKWTKAESYSYTKSDRVADILAYNTIKKMYGEGVKIKKTLTYNWVKLAEKLVGGIVEDPKVKV